MEILNENQTIKSFLSDYPKALHSPCLLSLCLLGIEIVKSQKIDLLNYISKQLQSPIPLIQTKITVIKKEIERIHKDFPQTAESLRTNASLDSIKATPQKRRICEPKYLFKDSKHEKKNSESGFIEIAESFLNTNLIKEIYTKELISERLRIPFRKKWDDACNRIG